MASDAERAEAEELAATHRLAIAKIDGEIADLQRRRAIREGLLAKAELTAKGIDPCRKCNRHVQSPCHDADGYYGEGPWDGHCREMFR